MDLDSGPFRWLNGTPVIPALYASAEGVKIIRKAGIDRIREKSLRMTARLIELADERGYRVFAPRGYDPARRGGTIAFDVPNGYEVAQTLLEQEILVDYRVGAGIRVAPHFFTLDSEIDRLIAAIDTSLRSGSWKRFAGKQTVVT
jgi:kynureninase